ncbi:MAG: tandem-95 repeat protein [Hyphomicrobiales bacterium]
MVLSTSSPISGESTEVFVFSDIGNKIVLPSAPLLFKGDYERDGPDLLVSLDGETVRVIDYFTHAEAPALYAPEGTLLQGSVVESLAGPLAPGQYAQSGAAATARAIGQVEELSGGATVQRADGTTEQLQVGTKVFSNDVVQTADGSKLSLTFVDGTIFTLASASRMILDELIYDPSSTENSGIFNLVEGSFVFIAGQAAKTGGLEIKTPAATMGIRGTTVRVDIVSVDGRTVVEVSLNRDPDGETGIFTLTDLNGNEIATIDSTETKWIVSPIEGETREIDRSPTDLNSDQVLITDAVNAFQSATQRVQQGGNFVENNGATEQQGNDGEQDASPEDSGQDAAPDSGAPDDGQQENGGEEQDRSLLDSSGIETDLASFDGSDLENSVDIPVLESGDVEVEGIDGGAGQPSQSSAPQEEATQETVVDDDIETGDLPTDTDDATTDTDDVADTPLSIDLPTLTTSVAEDGSIGISGFSISGPEGVIAVVTLVAGSTVTLAPNSGVTILVGTGTNDETVQIQGTFEQINAALNGDGTGPTLIYAPSPNADDEGTLDVTVEVNGETVSARLNIDILPQQDAPTAADDALNIGENGALTVGNLLDNDSDPDTNPTPDTLTVVEASVDGAPLAFGVATALAFGGTFVVNANGAYSFDPTGDFDALAVGETATQTINYQVTDGNGNFDDAILTITVTGANDAPIVSALTITTNENNATVGQLVASDVDASDTLTFSLDEAPTNGSVIVNADGSFTYTPNTGFDGTDSFDFIVDDGNGGTATETVTVTVNAVNDAPTLAGAPLGFGVNEDVLSALDLSDIVVGDIDSNVTLTLSVDQGSLSANGGGVFGAVTVTEVDALTVTISGAPADVTAFLDGASVVSYQGPLDLAGNNVATLTYSLSDGVAPPVTDTANITLIAVNDAPVFDIGSTPTTLTVNEDTFTFLAGLDVSDVDAGSSDLSVTLVSTNGFFTIDDTVSGGLVSSQITDNGTGSVTLVGTAAEINATFALAGGVTGIRFQGNQDVNGAGTITFSVDDGGATGAGGAMSDSVMINTNILADNDDPTAASIPTDINVVEGVESQIDLSGITFSDVDSADIIVSLVVSSGQFTTVQPGSVIGPDLSVNLSMVNFQVISLSGSAADINAYLNDPANITFTGQIGITGDDAATISISANDGDGSGAVSLGTVNLDIAAPNASPTIMNAPSDFTIQEDTLDTLNLSAIEFEDLDGDTLTLTLTVDNGTFAAPGAAGAMSGVTVTQDSATSITIVGQAADIETYLDTVTNIQYQGALNANGNDAAELTLNVSDGISTATSNTINIDLSAVNDAPTATSVPTDISVSVNTASNVDLSNVVLADVDGDQLTVTLSVDIGEFATPAMGGSVTVTQIDAETITLVGSAADINTYLDTASNIQFIGPVDVTGEDAAELSIDVDDGTVNVPAGPVNIDIQGVNAAPSLNLDGLTASEFITNGDFETTGSAVSTGENVVAVGATDITGFTVSGEPVSIVSNGILDGDGNAIRLALVGNGPDAGTISQTIETIIGRTYEVSVTSSEPNGSTNGVNGALAVRDTNGDVIIIEGLSSGMGAPVVDTIRFVATETVTNILLSGQPAASSGGGRIVDDLTVSEVRPDNTFVAQEGASTSLEGIVIDDIDSASSANFSVTLTVASGTLSDTNGSSPVTIAGSGTNTLVLTGTLADINNEIAGGFVTYDGAAGFRGLDTLTITANDGDAAGVGGAQSFTQTVDVVVGNTGSIIVGTNQADNNVGTGQDDIIFSLDSTNGTDVGNFLNGNDVYIGGAGQEDVDGQAGDDFIFGAGGNDVLDGFTGNDTLSGGDGDDTLIDLAGEAGIYDGGDGQDTFSVSNAGTIDLTAIENSAFTSIETLNVFNGEVNVLTLDETDIFDLSETSNAQLETILGASLPQSILIVAEAGDTVNLQLNDPILANYRLGTPTGGFTIVEVTDGEGSTVLATIGISDAATVVVEGLNNAPVVTTGMITTAFNEGDPAVVVNNTIEVSDADGDMITGATVSITLQSGVFETGDVLNFTDTGSITGSFDDTTGVLTLTGTDTAANYQAALRSITFESAREDLNDLLRDVDFVVNDGTVDSAAVTSVVNPTSVNDAPTIDVSGVVGEETLANGSFETPVVGSGSSTALFGSTAITGFTVGDGANATTGTGNVDIVDTSFIIAADGNQAIDLDGDTAGAITTTLTTEIGATYEVSFQFAGNPGGDNGVRSANVIVGNQTQTISFDTAGFNFTNLIYQTQTIVFTAVATTTELTFESLSVDGSDEGILIDDVSVREVTSSGVSVGVGGSFIFSDLVFDDPDGDPSNATVTLEVANGTLTLGAASTAGLSIGGDGTGTLTLNGALSTINTFFESDDALSYANTSGVSGDVDNLTITVNDGGGFGSGVAQSETASIPITLGSNTIAGTAANNTLSGGAGADVIDGLAGNDTLNGLGGNDLLLGGDGDDTINGGDGDDLLVAGSGADSLFGNDGNDTLESLASFGTDAILDGGAGDDSIFVDDFATLQIDGGTGRDELRYFQSGNIDLRSTGILIDGVEALSIENGEANTLFLDLARLQGLSADSDTDLEALLDQALTAGRTILGDAGDTVNVEVDVGFTFTQNTALSAGLQDDNGNQLDVFEFVETSTGDVFATVAVEEQVTVVTS